jgi:hypothetical protein
MKAIYDMMKAQTKLEVGASADLPAEKLRALMKEVAADLFAAAEEASPLWGQLTGLIRDLDGRPKRK